MMRLQPRFCRNRLSPKSFQKRCYVVTPKRRTAEDAGSSGPTPSSKGHSSPDEPIGRGFYVSIATIAGFLAFYKFSRSSSSNPADAGDMDRQPIVTRLLNRLLALQEEFRIKEVIQVEYLDAAGRDRRLFQGVGRDSDVQMFFPEAFNTGSVRNVPAGSQANLDELYDFYDRQQTQMVTEREERARRLERIRASQGVARQKEGEQAK